MDGTAADRVADINSDDLTPYEDLVNAGVRAFTNDGLGVASDAVMNEGKGHPRSAGA